MTSADMGDTELTVTCEWLNSQIEEGCKNLVILDVSWYSDKNGYEEYLREHIPGAVYFDIMQDVEMTPLHPRLVPTSEVFQRNVRAVGVNGDSHVIVYSNTDMCGFILSSRAWWMFKYFGHDKVSVLDGGWQKWVSGGYSKTSNVPVPKEGSFSANKKPSFRKTFEEMQAVSSQRSAQILESRAPITYDEGHISGAKNLPVASLVDTEKGVLRDKEELIALFETSGVDLSKPVMMYCCVGISSCSLVLAALICGGKGLSLYPEGYTEWKHKAGPDLIEKS